LDFDFRQETFVGGLPIFEINCFIKSSAIDVPESFKVIYRRLFDRDMILETAKEKSGRAAECL